MTNKITNVEELMSTLETMRAAQREFATFTQEQVDELFYKAAMAINNLIIGSPNCALTFSKNVSASASSITLLPCFKRLSSTC